MSTDKLTRYRETLEELKRDKEELDTTIKFFEQRIAGLRIVAVPDIQTRIVELSVIEAEADANVQQPAGTMTDAVERILKTHGMPLHGKSLETYMSATYVKDIEVLRRLHIKARHFFATALTDDKLQPRAILVVDSITDESPFDDTTTAKVSGYVKIFSTTF